MSILARGAPRSARARLRDRLRRRRRCRRCCARDRRGEDQGRHQRRRREPARLPRRRAPGSRRGRRGAQGRGRPRRRPAAAASSALRAGMREMDTGAALPARAAEHERLSRRLPIARALAAGADVVITGRCVDSAVTLGPLIHEFGWAMDDHDRLAAGTLAGHIIECGARQPAASSPTGERCRTGTTSAIPIAECRADGTFVLTKPAGTGGLITPRHGRRADALRDRRPARLRAARRGLRLPPVRDRAGRPGSRARRGRARPAAHRHLQGLARPRPTATGSARSSSSASRRWPRRAAAPRRSSSGRARMFRETHLGDYRDDAASR